MEIDIMEVIILGVMVISAFSLGSIIGRARLRRKIRRASDTMFQAINRSKEIKLARYAPDKGESQMEVCEIEEKEPKEDDETRDGRDGWGIGEGHEKPPE